MTKIQAVRKEYGESFKEVVAGYALLGYSQRATAQILDFNRSYFRQILTRFDLHSLFRRKNYNDSCKARSTGRPKGKPGKKCYRYADAELLTLVQIYSTGQEMDKYAPPYASTVIRRFGSWRKAKALSEQREENKN